MDSTIFDRICAIIQKSPRSQTESGRLELLNEAYRTEPVPVVLEECCRKRRDEFASCITRQAKDFTLSDGHNVLVRLLDILHRDLGAEDQLEADALVRVLNAAPPNLKLPTPPRQPPATVSSQAPRKLGPIASSGSDRFTRSASQTPGVDPVSSDAPEVDQKGLVSQDKPTGDRLVARATIGAAVIMGVLGLLAAFAPVLFPLISGILWPVAEPPMIVAASPIRVAVTEGAECSNELNEGEIRFVTNAQSSEWELCHYLIRPNRFINPSVESQSPLGVLSAKMLSAEPFFFDSVTTTRSSAYLEMVTFDEGIGLQIHCGLVDDRNGLQAFYSVSTVGPPETLKCSETIDDKDPSDGRCGITRGVFGELLEWDIAYEVRLEAMQESPGNFLCTVNDVTYGPDFIRMVDTNFNRENLTDLQFQRWIEVNMEGPRESLFVVSDIKESR